MLLYQNCKSLINLLVLFADALLSNINNQFKIIIRRNMHTKDIKSIFIGKTGFHMFTATLLFEIFLS